MLIVFVLDNRDVFDQFITGHLLNLLEKFAVILFDHFEVIFLLLEATFEGSLLEDQFVPSLLVQLGAVTVVFLFLVGLGHQSLHSDG